MTNQGIERGARVAIEVEIEEIDEYNIAVARILTPGWYVSESGYIARNL